jgi:hypothetical protein
MIKVAVNILADMAEDSEAVRLSPDAPLVRRGVAAIAATGGAHRRAPHDVPPPVCEQEGGHHGLGDDRRLQVDLSREYTVNRARPSTSDGLSGFLSEARTRQMRRRALPSACGDGHGHEMRGVTGFDAHQDRVLARRARLLEGLAHV